jgi:iron(III) transport system permease protein
MTATEVRPPAIGPAPLSRRPRRPLGLTTTTAVVVTVLALPLVFLILQAVQTGWSQLRPVLFRQFTLSLLWNTARLTVVVTALCALVGTLAAWLVERTDLPGRRVWAVLLVLPIAVPDFVVSFGWVQLAPGLSGFPGAVLVMTFAVYPFVYLPVAASLRRADPAEEEVARSLGLGPVRTFWRVTVGQVRLAILGGSLIVALVILAEYGAFEILRYRTFTTEIYTEYLNFGPSTAGTLSLVLVVLSLAVLSAEGASRGGGRVARSAPMAARPPVRHRLGRGRPLALAGCGAVAALALGVPFGEIISLLAHAGRSSLPGAASLWSALWHTVLYSAPAGVISTAVAVPVAVLSLRHPSRLARLFEKGSYLVLGLPGIVIALTLVFFSERYLAGNLYQGAVLLIVAYSMMFFPLALIAVRASLAQSPVRLEEVARSLGQGRLGVLWRVTLPLVAPGLAVGFCLVFLEAMTELTATLVLIPPSTQTLSTQFWAFQTNGFYGQAALYATVIVALAAVPGYALGRWFDRLPSAGSAT